MIWRWFLCLLVFGLSGCNNSKNLHDANLQLDDNVGQENVEEEDISKNVQLPNFELRDLIELIEEEKTGFKTKIREGGVQRGLFDSPLVYYSGHFAETKSFRPMVLNNTFGVANTKTIVKVSKKLMQHNKYGEYFGDIYKIDGLGKGISIYKVDAFESENIRIIPHFLLFKDGSYNSTFIEKDLYLYEPFVKELSLIRWKENYFKTKSHMRKRLGHITIKAMNFSGQDVSSKAIFDEVETWDSPAQEKKDLQYFGNFSFFSMNDHLSGHLMLRKRFMQTPNLLENLSVMGLVEMEYAYFNKGSKRLPVYRFGGKPPVFFNKLKLNILESSISLGVNKILTELNIDKVKLELLRRFRNSKTLLLTEFDNLSAENEDILKRIIALAKKFMMKFKDSNYHFYYEEVAEKITDMVILGVKGKALPLGSRIENPYDFSRENMSLSVVLLSNDFNEIIPIVGKWIVRKNKDISSYMFHGVREKIRLSVDNSQ